MPPPRRPVPAFGRWVARSVRPGESVLNVGGGCNTSGLHPGVRRRAGRLVTVDPSERVQADAEADERHQLTLEEFAVDHPEEFDVAFAVFVLEHVADPAGFAHAAARVLRPGGRFFAITPNRTHYFGMAAWAARRLGVEERLLARLRDPDTVASYHVPTEYRINSIGTVRRHLLAAGFTEVELRMWDLPRMYEPYLPHRVRRFATWWHRLAYRAGRPWMMGHLTVRAVKGPAGDPRAPEPGP